MCTVLPALYFSACSLMSSACSSFFMFARRMSALRAVRALFPCSGGDHKNHQDGILLTFQDVGFSLKGKGKSEIQILSDVTGYFAPGTLTATMGPSGAGKTTFLDIVTGRKTKGKVTGTLLYDGKVATKEYLKNYTAYVEQFDNLLAVLTVKEMLLYQAELKCSTTEPYSSKVERVDLLLKELGLEKCKDVMIGDALHPGISGGQAKRTNIGIALVTQPQIIFLDEPTSGLDSATSLDVCQILKNLTSTGVTIMTTIHSPTSEAFRLFDNLLLLVKGRVCYFGKMHGEGGVAEYLSGLSIVYDPLENLADFIIRETGERSQQENGIDFAAAWTSAPGSKTTAEECGKRLKDVVQADSAATKREKKSFRRHNPLSAIGVLLRYRTRANYKFPDFMAPRMAPSIVFGLIVMSLYSGVGAKAEDFKNTAARGNIAGALFMSVALPSFTAAGYMPSIVQERPLFYRESADGCYPTLTYILFKLLEEAIPNIVASLIFVALTWGVIELPGNFFWHWIIYYFTGQTGIALAYAVSAVARNMDEANTLLPIYNVTGMFFTGLLFTFDDLPVGWQWYTWTCFVRYAWSAHMVNNFGDECEAVDALNSGDISVSDFNNYLHSPSCPVEYYGFKDGSAGTEVLPNFLALMGFWVFWVLVAWAVMSNVRHAQR
ncbi:ABC transporter [Amphidinium carterae]